jgi:hypothetical protein
MHVTHALVMLSMFFVDSRHECMQVVDNVGLMVWVMASLTGVQNVG